MSKTSDRLPTDGHNIPASTGDVSNIVLSPRSTAEGVETLTPKAIRPDSRGLTGTNAPFEISDCQVSDVKTSDRLPTEPHTTSDRRFDTVARYEAYVDDCISEALLELSTMSQVRAASTEVQAADANALRLPVNSKGRGLTEDPVGDFARERAQADRIREVNRRLSVKVSIAQRARAEISSCRFARRRVPDAGTQEGRLAQALYARAHGTRRAAEVYCADPSDPKSVKRQQRNIQNYLVELAKVEGKQ